MLTPHQLQLAQAAAVQALQAEAAALQTLSTSITQSPAFAAALQIMQATQGRVIVTGVGKSGHIGGKIAATLASTGTPAQFVHPTEALHGDLGMLTRADSILALSHSGESKELGAIITHAARFGIPLIALTGAKSVAQGSTLASAAQVVLNTQVVTEACPLNLAPTTSTTAALALADALAVALMAARGFTAQDFAVFHPGGKLGAQLLRVAEVMVKTQLPLVPSTAPVSQLLVALTTHNLGCVGVLNGQHELVGMFTDGDLKRRLNSQFLSQTAADVMTPHPKTITPEVLATSAVAAMEKARVSALWVVQQQQPVGLIRLQDCLHAGVV